MCDLVTPREAAAAMGAPVDQSASSSPEACAYISTVPASGATDNAALSFGVDTFDGTGRSAFDKKRERLQITDVAGVGDAAIMQDNQNGTGKLIFLRGDTVFNIDLSTGVNVSVANALVTLGKIMVGRL